MDYFIFGIQVPNVNIQTSISNRNVFYVVLEKFWVKSEYKSKSWNIFKFEWKSLKFETNYEPLMMINQGISLTRLVSECKNLQERPIMKAESHVVEISLSLHWDWVFILQEKIYGWWRFGTTSSISAIKQTGSSTQILPFYGVISSKSWDKKLLMRTSNSHPETWIWTEPNRLNRK